MALAGNPFAIRLNAAAISHMDREKCKAWKMYDAEMSEITADFESTNLKTLALSRGPFSSAGLFTAVVRRCRAGPAFKRTIKRAYFGIAQQESDLCQRVFLVP